VILQPILHKTFTVAELGNRQMTLLDLLEVGGETPKRRDELGVGQLQKIVDAVVTKTIGGVEVGASTEWPSVSEGIVASVVEGVNAFNEQTRRSQTSSERKLAEQVMESKLKELQAAENRMKAFQRTNRMFRGSPDLEAEHDAIERELLMRQQVYTTVAQSYEDAKIREARDTPVITVLEPPYVPTLPEPRGRINSVIVGLILGSFFGAVLAFAREMFARRAQVGDIDALELADTLHGIKTNSLGRVKRLVRPSR
jgi:hypothetical protein